MNSIFDRFRPRDAKQAYEKKEMILNVGDRVRLVMGDLVDSRGYERYDYCGWIAGKVPAGTEGTIIEKECSGGYRCLAVEWDGITPKEGWYFGLAAQAGKPYTNCQIERIETNNTKGSTTNGTEIGSDS